MTHNWTLSNSTWDPQPQTFTPSTDIHETNNQSSMNFC
jgi:hypothetical protein